MRWRALPAMLAALVILGCPDHEIDRIMTPPEVEIVSPDDELDTPEYPAGELVEIVASISDSYDSPPDIVVEWASAFVDNDGAQQELELGNTGVGEDGRTTLATSTLPWGVHTIRCTATDSDDLVASDYVNIAILDVDTAPSVEIGSPEDGDVFQEGDMINFLAVATDDHDVTLLSVAWHSNFDGYIGGDPAAPNGMITMTTDTLTAGEQEVTVWVTDEFSNSSSDTVAFVIEALNQPPTDPVVYILPAGPMAEDDLTCVASGSVDPEGGTVVYEYAWDLDGAPTGWVSDMVPASQTMRGDEWTCRVIPYDDEELPGNEVSAVVQIENSLPSYSSVSLAPNPGHEDDVLECTPYGWADPDGDPEGAAFEWYVNSTLVGGASLDTLDGADYDHFDTVECLVYPDDGFDYGSPRWSNPVDILNTAPGEPTLEIQPVPPHVDQDITCAVVTAPVDPDPDTQTYQWEWYVDGVFQATLTTDTVPASELALGEEWTCRARANDGYEDGPWAEVSAVVVPYEGDLIITEIMIDPDAVDDTMGEYVEVYNASGEIVMLDDWIISDGVNQTHQITSGGTANVYPGDYFVLGINANAGTNGGVIVDYQYNGITLEQGFDGVVLSFGGSTVDEVQYDWGASFLAVTGASLSLDPNVMDAASNDFGSNWCGSTSPILADGDFGTPGETNDACDCWYSDDDGDGFGDDATCDPNWIDCDDNDPASYPGAFDVCNDGIDQDCDGADRECTCEETDLDGDGYGTTNVCPDIDCDDSDAAVHPGAVEICNGVDDDCDGDTDEGYDGDVYGVPTCMGDCDDNNAAIFPGNPEVCDGFDNDCSGGADEGYNLPGCVTYYLDADGDGFGLSGDYICSCDVDGNYDTELHSDCDDTDPDVNPDASEVCDSVDNDCDGNIDEVWGDCTVANGVAGCSAGQCVIASCDSGYFDMDTDYASGCEVAGDSWESYGGDTCATVVDAFNDFTDYPSTNEAITGNIAYDHFFPSVDEDWYLVRAVDTSDVDGSCDPFDVEVFFSDNPNSDFNFEIYDTGCNLWATPGNACGNDLTEFNWDSSGECPCVNGTPGEGQQQCTDNSITFLIRVYRSAGGPDGTEYTVTVSNG